MTLTPAEVAIRTMEAVERIADMLEDREAQSQVGAPGSTGYIGGPRPHLVEQAHIEQRDGFGNLIEPLTEND